MNLASNKIKKIFLCKDTTIDTLDKLDIILSPEFYWVRIFDIPVKSISQARNVLPTLFEDIIENVKELSYQIIKLENGKFLCFAYENKKIFNAIKNSGLNLSLVNAVYFAQNEFKGIEQFTSNEKAFSFTKDGILVKIPKLFLTQNIDINENINKIELSSHKVNIKLYNDLINTKQINLIILVIVLFSLINLVKIFDYTNETSKLNEKIKIVRSTNNMPKSILQVNSILNSYDKNIKAEVRKREAVDYIFKNKNFNLQSLELIKNTLVLKFINSDRNEVENYLSSKYKILSSSINNLNLYVRIKL